MGIKPRDTICVPSLAGPGGFIEDWEVTDVSYRQTDVGGVYVSISGERPFTGEANFVDGATLAAVQGIVAPLTTPALWNQFYWVQGPAADYPPTSV